MQRQLRRFGASTGCELPSSSRLHSPVLLGESHNNSTHVRSGGGTVDIGAYEYQGDGSVISYAWLQRYGLCTEGSADCADPDYDGMNNRQEWLCGTDPSDRLSALRLLSAVPAGTNLTVSWQSVAGVNYSLERSANLAASFTLLATNIVGQAGTTSYVDTNATGAGPFFYRVGVKSP
jgi:hypothetical protein